MRFISTFVAAVLALAASAAQAQDPPARVGRLAHTEGAVSVYMDPELGWEPAYVNTPITSENSVWTDVDSRAEVRVGPMAIRLDETTQLDVAALDEGGLHATIVRGAVNVRVRHFLPNDRIEIDTPQARFVLLAEGRYRIDADPERGDSRLTVFAGRASLESGRGRVAIGVGNSVVVWGEGRSSYAMQKAFTTPFDTWASSLDSRWVERTSTQYVSTSMTGYEDLDRYGQWIQEPDYGPLWVPTRVETNWVPYRDGHWSYVRPWGWTWIDDQPWGYAPFHYGRWVYVRDRWSWYPGQRVEHPVWAPALVAWVGGSNFSVGVRTSSPVVGWYPLSPFETYRPWYRANTTYVNNINVITLRDNHRAARYSERQREIIRERASTVVQSDSMLARRNVRQAMVQVSPEMIRREQPAQQPTSVLPSRTDAVRARTERSQQAASAPASAASTARSGSTASAGTPPGVASAAPAMPPPSQRPSFARQQAAPAPQAAPANATPPPAAAVSRAVPPGQANSRYGPGAQPPAPGMPPSAKGQEAIERRDTRAVERDQQQAREAQDRAAREAQQQQQKAQQDQQRQQADQQRQQQEKASREAQQQQQQQQQQRAQQDQQRQQAEQQKAAEQQRQQQEKASREVQQQQQQQQRAQQDQQRQQQEKAARDAQQQQEKAAREAQQQQQQRQQADQQRQQQEKAARDAQQQQEKAAREAQQQQQQRQQADQQRQQQEKAARDAQQQQEKAAREAQQQQQQQQRAQQDQQRQQQEKAAREAQQQQQQQQRAQPPQQPAAQPQPPPQQPPQSKGREKTQEEKDKEEKEKAAKGGR